MSTLNSLDSTSFLLDIETDGLSSKNNTLICIGILFWDQGEPTLKHWFIENKNEENVLKDFLLFINPFDTIYTYHGRTFDCKFILNKLASYGLDASMFLRLKCIDFNDSLKHIGTSREALEKILKFKRKTTLTSQEIIKLYHAYRYYPKAIYKTLILSHQKDELYSLFTFFEMYNVLYKCDNFDYIKAERLSSFISFSFKCTFKLSRSIHIKLFDWEVSLNASTGTIIFNVPVYRLTLKHYLLPLKDYFYIESERQVIHKSLAAFIPSHLKRKPSKEEATLVKTADFIQLVDPYKCPYKLWYDTNSKIYIDLEDFSVELLQLQVKILCFTHLTSNKKNRSC